MLCISSKNSLSLQRTRFILSWAAAHFIIIKKGIPHKSRAVEKDLIHEFT